MKIDVLSRLQMENYSEKRKHAIISISGPETKVNIPENNNCREILFLKFHDIDIQLNNMKLFTIEDAEKILKFVFKHKDYIDKLFVHCQAGISRSSAVAAALSKIIYNDDTKIFNSPLYCPNMMVYNTILKTYHIREYSDGNV